jgi:hypothetical protein
MSKIYSKKCSYCGKEYGGTGKSFCSNHCAQKARVRTSKPTEERFWSHVEKKELDECWEWQARKNMWGYGVFHIGLQTKLAHRVRWEIDYGEIPTGMCILHKCDNPACVNPSHLWIGTHKDNSDDKMAKGRESHKSTPKKPESKVYMRGSRQGSSKLKEENVIAIRIFYQLGSTLSELAKMYNISKSVICNIVHRKSWTHV